MKFKRLIIFWSLFLVTSHVMGQQMPNIVPPSPEAASVFKFTDIPVSLYTGLPNVNIPLFEIESGGVTVPISISYHARGIKVAEIASRVGLGWALNAGGIVSRQIRSKIDDGWRGYRQTYTDGNGNVDFFNSPSKRANTQLLYDGTPDSEFDYLPDQYFYSTGTGLAGKFIYDYTDGSILDQKFSNSKIVSPNEIIDSEGNTYYFSLYDYDTTLKDFRANQSGYLQTDPITNEVPNTWHLSRILTHTGKEINFSYQKEMTRYFRRSYDAIEENELDTNEQRCYFSEVVSTQYRISEISFNQGKVLFEYGSEVREDLKSEDDIHAGRYLKRVKLVNAFNEVIQTKEFNYEYTDNSMIDSSLNMNYFLVGFDERASKRLFLTSVKTIGNNNATMPPYKFEYDSTKLPSRHSNSQDIWGFYNGAQNGQFLMSNYEGTATRKTDTIKNGAGMLKKIILPEGGSTTFYYEQNKVYSNYPSSKVYFGNPNPVQIEGFNFASMEYLHTDPITNLPIYNATTRTYTKRFVVPETVTGTGEYKLNLSNSLNCGSTANQNAYCNFEVSVYNMRTQETKFLYINSSNDYKPLILESGTHILKVYCRAENYSPTNNNDAFVVVINWTEFSDTEEGIVYAAGKRIKKIEYHDAQQNLERAKTKTYDYNDVASGLSSGRLFGLPNFVGVREQIGPFTVLEKFGNTAGSPLSTYQEFSLGYETVTEYLGDEGNNIGRSVYKFTMTPETNDFYTFPYHPPVDHEWIRGKELSVSHHRRIGNAYIEVKRIENTYIYAGNSTLSPASFYSLPYRNVINENLYCPLPSSGEPIMLQCTESGYKKDKRMFRLPLAAIYYNANDTLMYKVFHLTGGTVDLHSTKTTDYFDNGTEIKNETNYSYNYNKHYNTASVENTGSDGSTNTTKYYYAGDDPIVQSALYDKNMVSIPLLTQNFKGTELLSQQETTYKNWDNIMLAPEFMKSSKGDKPLETRVEYVKVDPSNGNPLEVKQSGGMSICYIWGYNKTKPIAKIENVTYATVASYVSNLQTLSNGQNETALIGALNSLRTALPNAMVTTFSYKPLIGVSTITNPSGQKTTYDYDNFGRLKSVKDHNGHLLSENKYHYAAPTN